MARKFETFRPPLSPLGQGPQWSEWSQWFLRLFQFTENTVLRTDTSGDENAAIKTNQSYHGVTALTASRTVTLPSASELEDGHMLVIKDESGDAGTYTIVISRAGSDTINGATSTSITSNYGAVRLIRRTSTGWFTI